MHLKCCWRHTSFVIWMAQFEPGEVLQNTDRKENIMDMRELNKQFLTETEHTGRHIVVSMRTGHKYYIEPLDGKKIKWGDLNPATGKIEGNYGSKYKGSIPEKDYYNQREWI